ncbi:MAG: VWA domain-containing protein [Sandaracinus sp.]|nr:VWA domain-containing protein [Sandaracinus sp.]
MTKTSLFLLLLALGGLVACGDDDRPGIGRDAGGTGFDGGGAGLDGTVARPDVGPLPDPFDPRNGCGATAIETERVPGSVLLVFDFSTSMNDDPSGGDGTPSKWDLATDAINDVLTSVPDDLNMGLMLFPDPGASDDCDVVSSPQVAVGPLSTTRSEIASRLSSTPSGGSTPIVNASRSAWNHMLSLSAPGQKGVIVVSDGSETCERDASDEMAVHMEARTNNLAYGVTTYAVGLNAKNSLLSGLAYYGGTPRTDTCIPDCSANGRLCTRDADCTSGATCQSVNPFPIPGFPDILACQGGTDGECCHYTASSGGFRAEFEAALEEIAQRFLDSCVFDLPRGSDPGSFDAGQVNVGVTFSGEERTVLGRSEDTGADSWNYTSDAYDSIVIQGPICERLLSGDATVEIVLGCPTILI